MERMDKSRHRLRFVIAAVTILWAALTARLYYLQVMSHEELSEAAASQYQVVVEGLDTRGAILDRNLQPLTGGTESYYYFLQSSREDEASVQLLAAVSARKISTPGGIDSRYTVYRSQMFDETVNDKLKSAYGAYVFSSTSRYSDDQLACHLIGYLNESEKKGVAGLEQLYETTLQADGRNLALWADSSGTLLLGISPKLEGGKSMMEGNLVTTIDSGVQRSSEAALEGRNLSGAVLVSDAESGQVLAWVSSPSFNPNTVADYLDTGGDYLINKCIQGACAPGSVFKIVVAAAAMEYGIAGPETTYECTGTTEVEGTELGCQAGPEGGHGLVDMYEAMAVSCNCYFANLGAEIGYERVLEMAGRLGFGQEVFQGFTEETAGNLPDAEETGRWDISNLSIGQGALMVTPAQVQQMISVVACGGVKQPLTVVKNQDNAASGEGESGEQSDGERGGERGGERVLSAYTAEKLERMLEMVMTEGTGSGLGWSCSVYGKTGTAEATSDGTAVNNCWFSGFCQVGGRKYCVTILVEQGVSGSTSALPVFHDISEYLLDRNFQMN